MHRRLSLSMRNALLATAIAALSQGAFAQQSTSSNGPSPDKSDATPAKLQEVIVTGSRIPVPANITATSPITIVSAQAIRAQGYTDAIDVLNSLPQNIISAGSDFGNQSNPLTSTGGIATVDLRGLGPQRTLVLVDGRRLGVGDPSTTNPNPAPDIDQIPTPLIERIDVVTGGASATYGSDAIAGVVNFVLKQNFQGIQIDGQYGFSNHDNRNRYLQGLESNPDPLSGYAGGTPPTGSVSDGNKHDLSVIMGTNFADGAGNVTGYFVYHDQAAVPGSARDYGYCQLITNGLLTGNPSNGVDCLGSSNSNRFTPKGLAPAASLNNRYAVVGDQFLPWPQPGQSPPAIFNYNQWEYLQREDKRYQAGFLSHYEINSHVQPYAEFSFMDDKSTAGVAPSGLFVGGNPLSGDGNYLINCSNPLLSAQEAGILCTPAQIAADALHPGSVSADVQIGRRNIEGGGRISEYEHQNFRFVGGVKGDLIPGWTYDAYGSYYYTTAFAANLNYLDYGAVANALQVTTGANGQPVCISGGSCVPYNIFKTGGVTAAALNYLQSPGTSSGNNTEAIVQADATGDLSRYGLTSPYAQDGLATNIGVDYRKDSVTFAPDAAELSGLLSGFSGASVPTNASDDVSEAFVEVRAPIAQHKPGAYDLTTDVGYRYSNYNTAGVTNTYKFEVQYAPIHDARLRFSLDRAVRAPNLVELFNAPSIGQFNGTVDPCAPTAAGPATATLAQCERSGVTPAEYGNGGSTNTITQCISGQCAQVIQGNPNLAPEVATTWSLGLSFTPSFLPNFAGSVDYYHIHLVNTIGSIPYNVILNGCVQTGNPQYCSQIVRDQSGSLVGATVAGGGYVLQQDLNTGDALVSGIDLDLAYRWHLPGRWGTMVATLNGSWLQHNTSTPYQGSATYDCAGLFGNTCNNGSVNPYWRHTMRVVWDTPWHVAVTGQWRFIGPSSYDNNSTNPLLANQEAGAYDPYNARIPGYSYFDLSAVYHVLRNLDVRAGAMNLFDKSPPVLADYEITTNAGAGNTFGTYDVLGRQVYMSFTAKF